MPLVHRKYGVFVCFYGPLKQWYSKLSGHDIMHCGLMVERDAIRTLVVASPGHRAKITDADKYHARVYQPKEVIYLGQKDVSLRQICNFLSGGYRGEEKSILFWYYITRHFFPNLVPRTCGLLTCDLLRMCEVRVKNHVAPFDLYKELKSHADDYHSWTGRGWEDYTSSPDSKKSFQLGSESGDAVVRVKPEEDG